MTSTIRRIGFVGTGVMGAPMAGHLLGAGYELVVNTRTRARAEPLLAAGAVWADSPAEAAAGADAVITMVGFFGSKPPTSSGSLGGKLVA